MTRVSYKLVSYKKITCTGDDDVTATRSRGKHLQLYVL